MTAEQGQQMLEAIKEQGKMLEAISAFSKSNVNSLATSKTHWL